MKILAIETSCDETAVAILEGSNEGKNASFTVLGNALYSQAPLHAPYGGVYPNLAKREHQINLGPLAVSALSEAGLLIPGDGIAKLSESVFEGIRDPEFQKAVSEFLSAYERPDIDMIAVTKGPGLEPALWTGINFGSALSRAWDIPLMGIDHMEGHIVSSLLSPSGALKKSFVLKNPELPLMALLISGGHTEFVLMREWFLYERIGETQDDAVGEAFDKVARLLGLTYPGGPQIAEFAARSRERGENNIVFPRPMINEPNNHFSFSGLKTAVLYKLQKMDQISEFDKEHIAEAFENAARDVITIKTERALMEKKVASFVVAGGVSANREIRGALQKLMEEKFKTTTMYFPDQSLTGDNAIMIGAAAYLRHRAGHSPESSIIAKGNLQL